MNSVEMAGRKKMKVGPVLHPAEHRVEERFRQFGLLVVDQEPDVEQLGSLPDLVAKLVGAIRPMQGRERFLDAVVVELDAVAHGLLATGPVYLFEAPLGARGALAEQAIVLVEPVDDRLGDLVRKLVLQGGILHFEKVSAGGTANSSSAPSPTSS